MFRFVISSIFFFLLTTTLFQCKKSSIPVCQACRFEGVYNGSFHRVAACYGCIPYVDSNFNGSFLVNAFGEDSLSITRTYDNYEWKFAFSDNGVFIKSQGLNSGFSFTFTQSDSLYFFENFGGGGGYLRETFNGKKL